MHSVTDRRTDGRTDDMIMPIAAADHCVTVRSAKMRKKKAMFAIAMFAIALFNMTVIDIMVNRRLLTMI